jgi:hypothetical protein
MLPVIQSHRHTDLVTLRTSLAIAIFSVVLWLPSEATASKSQWSVFEEQRELINVGPERREAVLNEIRELGADTLRVLVPWSAVAPDPNSKTKPAFDEKDPATYPGFGNYDDLIQKATAKGFRVIITLGGPIPVWATRGGRGDNFKPNASEYARFAAATGTRYSGSFAGLPRVSVYTIMNEPNHAQFLTPQRVHNSPAARSYRQMVARAVPALRASGHDESIVLVGELAPVAPAKAPGPLGFLRHWLCLDKRYKRLRGRAARRSGCTSFKRVDANGFAIHAYTRPVSNYRPRGDQVTIAVIRRLARALDRAARAARLPPRLPIYNTEFGIQTNPPDPYQGGSIAKQAQIINESEEISYHYSRLRSFSQYLLYDDPPLTTGPQFNRYRGFQSGLRFADGRMKVPSYDAYRFPLVVHRRGLRVFVWGRVRPGGGIRFAQLQRKQGASYVGVGSRIRTNADGYFTATANGAGSLRFEAFDSSGKSLGYSRLARPVRF